MKFKSLYIKGFGIFNEKMPPENRFFKFNEEGITVIIGRNERGKSTLMEALVSAIYGIPPVMRDLRRPWGIGGAYGANLEISVKGRNFIIERDFSTEEAHLTENVNGKKRLLFRGNARPGSRSGQARLFRETLENLGFPSQDVMKQLCFVNRMEMESGISDEIRRLVTGSGSLDYHRVISQLTGEYFKITRENPWQQFNKNRPRELEELILKKEELNEILSQAQEEKDRTLRADYDLDILIPEVEKLRAEYDRLSIFSEDLREALKLKSEEENLHRQLLWLVREKDRINHRKKQEEETTEALSVYSGLIELIEEPVDDLCRRLSALQDRLRDLLDMEEARQKEFQQLKIQKERMEQQLYDQYPELIILPENVEDLLKSRKSKEEEYSRGRAFYEEYLKDSGDYKARLGELGDFSFKPENYEKKLAVYDEILKSSKARTSDLLEKLNRRQEIEDQISEKWERVRKEYPGIETLPEDLAHRLRDYRSAEKHRQLKMSRLEKTSSECKELNEKIRSPKNFIPPVAGLGVGLAVGFIFLSSNIMLLVAAAIMGIMAGGFASWHRLSMLGAEETRIKQTMAQLKEEAEKPLPSLGVEENLLVKHTPEELIEIQRDYNAAVKGIEKLTIKATAMEDTGSLRKEMEKIAGERVKAREEVSLGPNDDPADVLERYRQSKALQEKLKNLKEIAVSRFPSIRALQEDPPLPEELESLKREIDEFDRAHPYLEGMPPFEILREDFYKMLVDKGRLKEMESTIAHSESLNPFGRDIDRCRQEEEDLKLKLKPLTDRFGPEADAVGREYSRYLQLSEALRTIREESGEPGEAEDVIRKMSDASDRLTLTGGKLQHLLLKQPPLAHLLNEGPAKGEGELSDLSVKLKTMKKTLDEKKDLINLLKARLMEAPAPAVNPLELSDAIDELSFRIERLTLMKEGLRVAVDLLKESVEQFQHDHRNRLKESVSGYFSLLTDNRYGSVELNQDFELELKDHFGQSVSIDALSSGARDQLYFAVRLSLAEALQDQLSMPFLLDDPFSAFDEGRLKTAGEILAGIAKNRQIILFSHSEAYAGWSESIYRLDGPGEQ